MTTVDPSRFSAANQNRARLNRLRELITLAALSAAFIFVGAIALGLLA